MNLDEFNLARQLLRAYLHPTPLVFNAWLSENLQCDIYLKLENMQPIGSFKIRGATYKISKLTSVEKAKGVIAASAGNHAQGVAWGSKKLGVQSLIVMPVVAPLVKIQNTQALGAEVLLAGSNYDEAFEEAKIIALKTGKIFIHAFEDDDVIAGQGTVALEILDQLPDVDYIVCSVGGGGLIAGVSSVIKQNNSSIQIIGCQASKAPSMIRSIQEGRSISLESGDTFADGIAVLHSSEKIRSLLSSKVDDWIEVEEDAIITSVLTFLEKAKITVEGAGAAVLGGAIAIQKKLKGKKVVLVISGGNIDVNVLSRIIDLGLIHAGRRVRVNVVVRDRPGTLAALTDLIAKQGANILQAIHDRNEPSARIDQTEVALTLETRGPEHSATLIDSLRKHVLRLELAH